MQNPCRKSYFHHPHLKYDEKKKPNHIYEHVHAESLQSYSCGNELFYARFTCEPECLSWIRQVRLLNVDSNYMDNANVFIHE